MQGAPRSTFHCRCKKVPAEVVAGIYMYVECIVCENVITDKGFNGRGDGLKLWQ